MTRDRLPDLCAVSFFCSRERVYHVRVFVCHEIEGAGWCLFFLVWF